VAAQVAACEYSMIPIGEAVGARRAQPACVTIRAVKGRAEEWKWTKVSAIHAPDTGGQGQHCVGGTYSYLYRYYPAESSSYERCIGLSWCSECRAYTGAMVHVSRQRALVDALAGASPQERDRVYRSEVRLLDYLDRLVRRGKWPPSKP
jgi:hypothetical protein